jgi:uncharacterized DUF497 family protein
MPYYEFQWTEEIEAHVNEHGISADDFMHVARNPIKTGYSRSSGLPAAWGYTPEGRFIIVVYDEIDELTLLPVTAYEVADSGEDL